MRIPYARLTVSLLSILLISTYSLPYITFAEDSSYSTVDSLSLDTVDKMLLNITENQKDNLPQLETEEDTVPDTYSEDETEGIGYVDTAKETISTYSEKWQMKEWKIDTKFMVNEKMKDIHFVLQDNTTGNILGYLAHVNGLFIRPGKVSYRANVLASNVRLFTDDPEYPVSSASRIVSDGDYSIVMIAIDRDNNIYHDSTQVFIDNIPADYSFTDSNGNSLEQGVVEISDDDYTIIDGESAFQANVHVDDNSIDYMTEHGLPRDQSYNDVYTDARWSHDIIGSSKYSGTIPIDADGNGSVTIEKQYILEEPIVVNYAVSDESFNVQYYEQAYVEEGTPYLGLSVNKEKVRLGDDITLTLTLNNVEDLVSSSFNVKYNGSVFTFEDISLNEDAINYINDNNLEFSFEEPLLTGEDIKSYVEIDSSFNTDTFEGVTGDLSLFDLTFKVTGENWFHNSVVFEIENSNGISNQESHYTNTSSENILLPSYTPARSDFSISHSTILTSITAEGFLTTPDTDDLDDVDLHGKTPSEIDAEIYALAPDGTRYDAVLSKEAGSGLIYTIDNLPADGQKYELYKKVPGHFTTEQDIYPSILVNGEYYGIYEANTYTNRLDLELAGDVNGDGVIDINDASLIVDDYKKTSEEITLPTDINQDDIVDEKDLRYVERNFMAVNFDATVEPQEKIGSKTLNYYLKKVGLNPL